MTSNPLINGVWEPTYVLNKIMLGLYDVWMSLGIEQARTILLLVADWFGTKVLDRLNDEQVQRLLVCEHGSLNESFVECFLLTRDEKYLAWAKRLNDHDMLDPLSAGKDILDGWHANTQIPKFTGFHTRLSADGRSTVQRCGCQLLDHRDPKSVLGERRKQQRRTLLSRRSDD